MGERRAEMGWKWVVLGKARREEPEGVSRWRFDGIGEKKWYQSFGCHCVGFRTVGLQLKECVIT